MADLVRWDFDSVAMGHPVSIPQSETHLVMRLWCYACNRVHALPLADVEKVIYILMEEACAETNGGFETDFDCLQVLATDEYLNDHVREGIQCRGDADA